MNASELIESKIELKNADFTLSFVSNFEIENYVNFDINTPEAKLNIVNKISEVIFDKLSYIVNAQIKLKNLGGKKNYFGFSSYVVTNLNIRIRETDVFYLFVKDIEFKFQNILNKEEKQRGSGLLYLKKLMFEKLEVNSYEDIDDQFYNSTNNKHQISNEIVDYEKFETYNPYSQETINILEDNYCNGKIIKKLFFDGKTIDSKFTDFQAFHICKGLKDKRSLYQKYIDKTYTKEDCFKAHFLANKLLKDKGRKIINLILSLPPLPFQSNQFKILFSTLDKIRIEGKNENPVIRLNIKNIDGNLEEIEFHFVAIDGIKYINQIKVSNRSRNLDLFSVSRNGKVLPKENNFKKNHYLNTTPILQLFYRITKTENNLKEAVLAYGLESGKCSVCGRNLKTEKSILKGIGPVCEKYF